MSFKTRAYIFYHFLFESTSFCLRCSQVVVNNVDSEKDYSAKQFDNASHKNVLEVMYVVCVWFYIK